MLSEVWPLNREVKAFLSSSLSLFLDNLFPFNLLSLTHADLLVCGYLTGRLDSLNILEGVEKAYSYNTLILRAPAQKKGNVNLIALRRNIKYFL